uniref:Hypothetical orf4 n=1 Tax=Epidermophyton floccosum TaxID=34391 RepID=Q3ZEH3_EPIFL|nr:hypothetical orf4 [Epidermophyton floccosum]AAW78230.1 hypothetical orf4 [Epidermophyton floccosum]
MNNLWRDVCFIDELLYKKLYLTHKGLYKDDVEMNLKKPGVFLINIRFLKKDTNILIYNYIFYTEEFIDSLIMYFIVRDNFAKSLTFRESGDFLCIIDKSLNIHEHVKEIFKYLNSFNVYLYEDLKYVKSNEEYKYFFFLDIIKKSTIALNHDKLIEVFNNIVKKNYEDLKLNKFTDIYSYCKIDNDLDLINDTLFLIKDINTFLLDIRKLGYVISQGPQAWRGQINSMNHFLNNIDVDYRDNLYNHLDYHMYHGTAQFKEPLPRKAFSFKNIHKKIGNIRF